MSKQFELSEIEISIVEEALFDYIERMGDGEAYFEHVKDIEAAKTYSERFHQCDNLLNRIDKWKRNLS